MTNPVKRRYHSPVRAEAARRTRQAILDAARELFPRQGYAATTVAGIAEAAGTSLDTVYAAVGRKPALFRLLVETAISGTDQPVPARQREYVARIRAASGAEEKIRIYARAVGEIQQRLAPLFSVLREAAAHEPELSRLWHDVSERRAANMREFVADLAATGELRTDLSHDEIADIVWSMNAAEYYSLLVTERGWTAERFGRWLADAWTRLLLDASPAA